MTSGSEDTHSYAVSLTDARGRWFTLGAVATAGFSLPTQVLFEHGLGVDGFAQWLLVNSLVQFFIPLSTLGSVNLILSEYFEGHLEQSAGRRALARFFAITTLLAAIGFIAVYGWAPLAGDRSSLDVALGVMVVIARTPVILVYPLFQIHHKSWLVAFWTAFENFGRFLIAVASVVLAMSFTQSLVWWLVLTALLAAIGIFYPGIRRLPPNPAAPKVDVESVSTLATRGARFGFAEYLDTLDLKLAIPIAALVLTTKQIAGAGLGLLLLNAVQFFPYAIVMRYLLPAIHSRASHDSAAVRATIRQWLIVGSAVSLAAGIGCALLGDSVIALVAKADYSDQRYLFAMVGAAMLPLCVSILGSAHFLRIQDAHRLLTWRVQGTLGFLVVTLFAGPMLGAAAPILGVLVSRSYLTARFVFARPT